MAAASSAAASGANKPAETESAEAELDLLTELALAVADDDPDEPGMTGMVIEGAAAELNGAGVPEADADFDPAADVAPAGVLAVELAPVALPLALVLPLALALPLDEPRQLVSLLGWIVKGAVLPVFPCESWIEKINSWPEGSLTVHRNGEVFVELTTSSTKFWLASSNRISNGPVPPVHVTW